MEDSPQHQKKAGTRRRLVGLVAGISIGGAIGVLGNPRFTVIPIAGSSAPADSLDLAVAVMLLSVLYLVGGVAAQQNISKSTVSQNRSRVPLRRPKRKVGTRFLRFQLVLVFVLFVYFNQQSWTAESVGFKQGFPAIQFIAGLLAYSLVIFTLGLLFRLRGNLGEQQDNTMVNMAALWPREPRQKLAMSIAVCILNPITEELLFRGILVYQLGLTLGDYELPVFLGLLATLWNHTYQGPRSILLHTLYYVAAVALLFSPAGMMGAIGMHYAGDIVPVSMMKTSMRRYRERHRGQDQEDDTLPIPPIEG